jgi:hypothetical protein
VGQLQLADVDGLLLQQPVGAQQRVEMAGVDAQLLQLGVVEGDDLAEELVGAHEALQVLAEQVELVRVVPASLSSCSARLRPLSSPCCSARRRSCFQVCSCSRSAW